MPSTSANTPRPSRSATSSTCSPGECCSSIIAAGPTSQPAAHADRAEATSSHSISRPFRRDRRRRAAAEFPGARAAALCGLFAGRRSAAALEDALTHLLGVEARVQEFQPRWRQIEAQDQSRLGQQFATLGSDAVAGQRVRIASDAFRVVVRTHEFRRIRGAPPLRARFAIAAEALDVRAVAPRMGHHAGDRRGARTARKARRPFAAGMDIVAAADRQRRVARRCAPLAPNDDRMHERVDQ